MKKKTFAAIIAAVMMLSGCGESAVESNGEQVSGEESAAVSATSDGTGAASSSSPSSISTASSTTQSTSTTSSSVESSSPDNSTPEPDSEQDKYANAPAPVFASRTMPEDYSTDPVPFKTQIDEFYKQVKVKSVPEEDKQTYNAYNNGEFTVRKLEIDGTQLYEIKKDDGKVKPLVFHLHPGFQHKDLAEAAALAKSEDVCMVTIDCSGSGESQDGPVQAPAAFMETVKDIDTLIEYYNTIPEVDAANFGMMGRSLGGNITMYYVVYGKYKPAAIDVKNTSVDLTNEGSVWDCFDKGANGQPAIWNEEQLWGFTAATAPNKHPELFKDIKMYICVGDQDDMHSPDNMEKFKNDVAALGNQNIVFRRYPNVGHETPQSWNNNEEKQFFAAMRG